MKLKKASVVEEDDFGVCLWRMPDGLMLGDDEGRFLSMEGRVNDILVESKMRGAAIHWLGKEGLEGSAVWVRGSRQVTDNEADDHMERMLEGRIPDPVDSAKQILRG